jgi:hypothetical protein
MNTPNKLKTEPGLASLQFLHLAKDYVTSAGAGITTQLRGEVLLSMSLILAR